MPYKINDTQNLGAIIRSAVAFNVNYILLGNRGISKENTTVAKVASGGIDYIKSYNYGNLHTALMLLKKQDWTLIAMDSCGDINIKDMSKYILNKKILIILGSENKGINNIIKNYSDIVVNIAINKNAIESINVSCASAEAFYEIKKYINHDT